MEEARAGALPIDTSMPPSHPAFNPDVTIKFPKIFLIDPLDCIILHIAIGESEIYCLMLISP